MSSPPETTMTITKDMLHDLLLIERFISSIPSSEQYKPFITGQRKRTLLSDLRALSLSMELSFTDRELRKIYMGQEINMHQHPIRGVRNTISALRYIDAQKDLPFTISTIQQVNKLLCDGYTEFWEEGKLRTPKESPSFDNDGFRNRPTTFSLESFNYVKYIHALEDIDHPLLKASYFLFHFLKAYPYSHFNLQTALVGIYAIIKNTPYAAKGLVSTMSVAWESLSKLQLSENSTQNVSVSSCAAVFLKSYVSHMQSIDMALEQRHTIPDELLSTLNERQLKALGVLKRKRKLSRRKYAIMNNVAIATAFRDLRDMVEKGLALSVGIGRGTYYMIAETKKLELTEDTANDTMSFSDDFEEINSLDEL
ncbi:MAG: hypothetical protein QY314_00075 [Candidatus Dojkabacteria bacterium]|nr:MAG: hypothetical protein QY314_00075 [Candidatus Dojkabacteria bacterium]